MSDLIMKKPGLYEVKEDGVLTHVVARIDVRNDVGYTYKNGFKPGYVERWIVRRAKGDFIGSLRYMALRDLLEAEFDTPPKRPTKAKTNGKRSVAGNAKEASKAGVGHRHGQGR